MDTAVLYEDPERQRRVQGTSLQSTWFKNKSKGKPELSLFFTLNSIKGELHSASKEVSTKVLARWGNWDGGRKVKVEVARICLRVRGLLDQRRGMEEDVTLDQRPAYIPGPAIQGLRRSVGFLFSPGGEGASTLSERHR